jgi:hypothetical protein
MKELFEKRHVHGMALILKSSGDTFIWGDVPLFRPRLHIKPIN